MSNKDRLYVCLFARGGQAKMPGLEDTYHWALLVGPKVEKEGLRGVRYHAKEAVTHEGVQWTFERKDSTLLPTNMLLVGVIIGKVQDGARLDSILREVPMRGTEQGWNCVSWVMEALIALERDNKALGTRVLQWNAVRHAAMTYCEQKKTEDRFQPPKFNAEKVPTYDLLQRKETIP